MTKALLPPRGTFIPSKILYDLDIPATVRDTYAQLHGLAWGNGDSETPPLSFEQLKGITGKSQAALYNHMTLLRIRGALRWRSAGSPSVIIISFADRDAIPVFQDSRILESPVKEEEEDIYKDSINKSPPPPPPQDILEFQNSRILENENENGNHNLSKALEGKLLEIGLYPRLLGEVIESEYTETDIRALIAECQEIKQDEPAAGLFMSRLRSRMKANKKYYQDPCPQCGGIGKHQNGCTYLYVHGEFADFIEH